MPEDARHTLYDALADPAFRRERPRLRGLARIAHHSATTPTQVALIGAILARTQQQWDQVEAICRPITVPMPGSRRVDRAQSWYMLSLAADARGQWLTARNARRQVRCLTSPRHPLWFSATVLDLEQAVRRRHSTDASHVRRRLAQAERVTQPLPVAMQGRGDVMWLASRLIDRHMLEPTDAPRLERACAWLLAVRPPAGHLQELMRLLGILVRIGDTDRAVQVLARLDHPCRPPDGRLGIAVEVDILAGHLALARGQGETALRRSTTARVGLCQMSDDAERERLTVSLHGLDAAVRHYLRRVESV
jgi:hypothetical protein